MTAPADAAGIEANLRSLVGLGTPDRCTVTSATRRSPPGGAFSRRWRRSTRSSSCSRTSTVLTAGSWTSSSTSLEWARDVRILIICTARTAALAEARPDWGRNALGVRRELPTTIELWPLSRQETGRLVAMLAGRGIRKETKTAIVGAASGNPLYAVEYRSDARRPSGRGARRPGDGPGDHRVAARLALGEGQGTSPGRGGGRSGCVARGAGRDRRSVQGVRRPTPPGARPQGVPDPRPTILGRRRARVQVPPRTRPGRCVRADPSRPAWRDSPADGRVARSAESRSNERSGRDAGSPLSLGIRACACRGRRYRGAQRPCATLPP